MTGAYVAVGALVAGGTAYAAHQASNAASAQAGAAENATQTQLTMYNQSRADQTPWRQAGGQALNALSQWYGLGGVGDPNAAAPGASAAPAVPQGYDPSSGYQIGAGGGIS